MGAFLQNIAVAWPSILMGAVIPLAALLVLYCSKARKEIAFQAVLQGFVTFLLALVIDAVLIVVAAQVFLPAIAVSDQANANTYIYVGGSLALLIFYLCTEAIKYFTFGSFVKQEKKRYAGLTFGCGFILAQNLLIIGLIYLGEIDMSQSLGFGVLMLISAVIYLLISSIGYELVLEHHRLVSPVLALSYYLMFAVMLLFANVYITYGFIAAVLVFNLIMAYVLLPLPFKKEKEVS